MKPYRLPADPAKAIKDHLAAVLPGLVGAPAPEIGLSLRSDWKPSSPPAVVVFDDGGPNQWPISTAPTIRVTVWANGRDRSRLIAGVCFGVLLSHRIPGIATITQPSGLIEAVDSNNAGRMCSFTVRALARSLAG
ncbi:hypothetical protein [Nocardia sp. CA-145437]|uniref:hypothetical protein n=1 Tax=Nocardia sp. CA-145437 TaxID=3239980 RepID=UPI003D97D30D